MIGRVLARLGVCATALALVLMPYAGKAADVYDIHMILSLTGPGAFIGNQQLPAIRMVEALVNRGGGIRGRPIHFVYQDDQSNPQVAVQIARGLIDQGLPLIVGPSTTASCNAVSPFVQQAGPVLYCLTPGAHLVPGATRSQISPRPRTRSSSRSATFMPAAGSASRC